MYAAPARVATAERETAQAAISLLSIYDQSRILIESGVYAEGSNPDLDAAIARRPALSRFLRQQTDEHVPQTEAGAALLTLLGEQS